MTREVLSDGEKWRVLHGDCLDVMRGMPDGAVDVTITDPPYAEKTHKGARTGRPDQSLVDFDSINDEYFLCLCSELVRVTRRWAVLTCDWRHSAHAFRMGAPVIRCGVWVKPDAAPQFTGDRPGTGWEAVLILHREGKKRWNGGGHHAVWTHPVERGNVHPTQKPLNLVSEWVRLFSDPGELIFDPYCGSGTTGVASVREGRRFYGVEQVPAYCEIARKRIADTQAQPCLGIEKAPRIRNKQGDLFGADGGSVMVEER